jgi:hypothetical protein
VGAKVRSQPLQSKKSKFLQQFDSQGLPEDYQVGNGFLTKLQKQVPLFNRPKSRENIPDKRFPTCKSKKGFLGCVAFWCKKNFSIVKGLT